MQIVKDKISIQALQEMSEKMYGNFVKAVVDIDQEIMMVDAEMHADLEEMLLEEGSEQKNLWGINLHPKKTVEPWIEFDSMINVRPSQDNRSRYVENSKIRDKIIEVVTKLVQRQS